MPSPSNPGTKRRSAGGGLRSAHGPPSRLHAVVAEALLRPTVNGFVRALWRPRLMNPEALPSGPCFFYGNHSNMLDAFVLNRFLPWGRPTAGVMTQERLRSGLAAFALRGIGLLPTKKRLAEPHLIRAVYRLLDAGRQVVIYPEGGQRWDGRPLPWIEATAKLFVRVGVPVYPVVTHGSYLGWPRWADHPRPARLQVEVKPPLRFERRTPLADALRQMQAPIAAHDDRTFPDACRPRRAYRPADGIDRLLYRDPDTGDIGGLHTPDGRRVLDRAGRHRYTVHPDSTLTDARTGQRLYTGDLYAAVRAFPLAAGPDGALARARVDLHTETDFPHLISHGPSDAVLYPDAIRLGTAAAPRTLPLEALHGVDIERNYKLQLWLGSEMVQLSFTQGGSALHWHNVLQRLGVGQ